MLLLLGGFFGFFLVKDGELLEKYNDIWEKVNKNIKKEFDSEPVYDEKYLKTKIKREKSKGKKQHKFSK